MNKAYEIFENSLKEIEANGLYKRERLIDSPQGVKIHTPQSGEVLNFCANNYLGLANHPQLINAAIDGLNNRGYGLASVRFICGTQDIHRELEKTIARFFSTDDAILYSSCFDANAGLFETLLGPEDAIISDALNHASIIDGVRLCKAKRLRYGHADMNDLETRLKDAASSRIRLIATDGVFSMDGDVAPLKEIVALAKQYHALVMVDDSHATGFFGPGGRGSAAFHGVLDEIDIFTSTMGKALGGASGGFTAAKQPVIDLLRQRSRPYLFSNTLAPALVAASIKAFELVDTNDALRAKLHNNTQLFRRAMTDAGFDINPGEHPIVPVMLYDARVAQSMAAALLNEGIYVVGFFHPVVPQEQARVRVQISAAHEKSQIERAIDAFVKVGKELGVLSR